MRNDLRNLKTSEIELRRGLPLLERDWLVARLRAQPGIERAACASDAVRLTVEYDADRLASADLVDFLNVCGVHVAAVHAAHA